MELRPCSSQSNRRSDLHDTLRFRQEHGHCIASHEKDHTADEYRINIAWIADLVKDRGDVVGLDYVHG